MPRRNGAHAVPQSTAEHVRFHRSKSARLPAQVQTISLLLCLVLPAEACDKGNEPRATTDGNAKTAGKGETAGGASVSKSAENARAEDVGTGEAGEVAAKAAQYCSLRIDVEGAALVPYESLTLPYAADSIVHLGSNFDATDTTAVKKPALQWVSVTADTEGVDSGVRDLRYTLELVKDYSSLYRASGYDVRASLRAFFASASGSASGQQSTRFSEKNVTFVVTSQADYGRYHLKSPKLSEAAEKLWNENKPEDFKRLYGTHVAIMERRSASIHAIATFQYNETTDAASTKATFEAKASFLVGSGGISASSWSSSEKTTGAFKFNVEFMAQGGKGISDASALSANGLGAAVAANDTDGALSAVLAGVNEYAKGVGPDTAPATEYFAVPLSAFTDGPHDDSLALELARIDSVQLRAAEGIALLREEIGLYTRLAAEAKEGDGTLPVCKTLQKECAKGCDYCGQDAACNAKCEAARTTACAEKTSKGCDRLFHLASVSQAEADLNYLKSTLEYESAEWTTVCSDANDPRAALRQLAKEQCPDCEGDDSFVRWESWFASSETSAFRPRPGEAAKAPKKTKPKKAKRVPR